MATDSKRDKRLAEIAKSIADVKDMDSPLHAFVWGRVKSGKTGFVGSGPSPILFACEDGTKTIRTFPHVQVFPVDERGMYRPPKWSDAVDFLYYLRYADHDRETVGVDTLTSLARIAIRFINNDEEARDEARAPGVTDRRTYGRLATTMNDFLEDLEAVCKERNMHLIYTAQERRLDEEKSIQEGSDFVPDLTPAVRSTVLEKPDIIARTFIEDDEDADLDDVKLKYGMQFRHAEWPVGERVTPIGSKPYLPARAFNVTIPKLLKRIEKAKKENS